MERLAPPGQASKGIEAAGRAGYAARADRAGDLGHLLHRRRRPVRPERAQGHLGCAADARRPVVGHDRPVGHGHRPRSCSASSASPRAAYRRSLTRPPIRGFHGTGGFACRTGCSKPSDVGRPAAERLPCIPPTSPLLHRARSSDVRPLPRRFTLARRPPRRHHHSRTASSGRGPQDAAATRRQRRAASPGTRACSWLPPRRRRWPSAVVSCAPHIPAGSSPGPTAGSLVGLRRMPPSTALHFSIRHGARVEPERGVRFRQTTALAAGDRRELPGGILVASWPRLAFDLAADLRPLDHLSVLHQLLHERRVTSDELVAIERRLGHPARPGSGTFLRSLSRLGGEPLRVPSRGGAGGGAAPPQRAHRAPGNAGSPGRWTNASRIDLAVPSARWGIELDIHPEHLTLDGDARDARRNRAGPPGRLAGRTGLTARPPGRRARRRRAGDALPRPATGPGRLIRGFAYRLPGQETLGCRKPSDGLDGGDLGVAAEDVARASMISPRVA